MSASLAKIFSRDFVCCIEINLLNLHHELVVGFVPGVVPKPFVTAFPLMWLSSFPFSSEPKHIDFTFILISVTILCCYYYQKILSQLLTDPHLSVGVGWTTAGNGIYKAIDRAVGCVVPFICSLNIEGKRNLMENVRYFLSVISRYSIVKDCFWEWYQDDDDEEGIDLVWDWKYVKGKFGIDINNGHGFCFELGSSGGSWCGGEPY
ncbi:MAG: hypothetical protein IKS94_00450 [Prevotella sp.]|nr:hypothetical protein [Prevotella sp.]